MSRYVVMAWIWPGTRWVWRKNKDIGVTEVRLHESLTANVNPTVNYYDILSSVSQLTFSRFCWASNTELFCILSEVSGNFFIFLFALKDQSSRGFPMLLTLIFLDIERLTVYFPDSVSSAFFFREM
jgi:hypothetical protein